MSVSKVPAMTEFDKLCEEFVNILHDNDFEYKVTELAKNIDFGLPNDGKYSRTEILRILTFLNDVNRGIYANQHAFAHMKQNAFDGIKKAFTKQYLKVKEDRCL
jgi:hypothetical protein